MISCNITLNITLLMILSYKLTPTSLTLHSEGSGSEHFNITEAQYRKLVSEYDDGSQIIQNPNFELSYSYFKNIVD